MLRFLSLLFLAGLASAGVIDHGECEMVGAIASVSVTDCRSTPCYLVKGRTYHIDVAFAPKYPGEYISYKLDAVAGAFTIPIVSGNGCLALSTGCPYEAGLLSTHRTTIFISEQFVEMEAVVKLYLTDDLGRNEVCVTAPVEIVYERKQKH